MKKIFVLLLFAYCMSSCDSITSPDITSDPGRDGESSQPDTPPVLVSPEDSSEVSASGVELSWNEVEGVEKYQIQLSTDEDFTETVTDSLVASTIYEITGLNETTTYYWRVAAASGEASSSNNIPAHWSEVWHFTTDEDADPSRAPALSSPEDQATDQPVHLTLHWKDVAAADAYQVQVAADQDFNSIITDHETSSSNFELSGLEYESSYFWRVRSITGSEESQWSNIFSFITVKESDYSAEASDIWVSAYLASWSHYAPPGGNWGNIPTEEIDWDAFTHLIYFAVLARPDGSLSRIADYENMAPDRIEAITRAGSENDTPVIISIGGWGNYDGFSGAIRPENRATFVANLVELITVWGFDGIDLDMEPIRDSDVENYKATVRDLHAALQALDTPLTGKPLLTAALMGSHASMFAELQDYFDQINIMTYDYSGAWEGWVSWHNSPLFSGGHTFPGLSRELPSVENTLRQFRNAGVDDKKLGIGMTFEGYVWHGQVDSPRQSWNSAPRVESNVPYHKIMDEYYSDSRYNWDSAAGVPYLSIPNGDASERIFVSYEDERSVAERVHFARDQEIGGVIIWELGQGHRQNQPAGQRDPLLQAIKEALHR